MTGNTGFAYINGADPFLVNYLTNRDFAAKDEMSWQIRHDYNFAGWGIPGLTVFNRFVKGTGADLGAGRNEGREWERDLDITYAFQEGALKNFSLRWGNATVRSNIFKDLDDNRIILSYSLALLSTSAESCVTDVPRPQSTAFTGFCRRGDLIELIKLAAWHAIC